MGEIVYIFLYQQNLPLLSQYYFSLFLSDPRHGGSEDSYQCKLIRNTEDADLMGNKNQTDNSMACNLLNLFVCNLSQISS